MFFNCIYEIIGLREHLKDIAGMRFHFNSPIAVVVHFSAKYHVLAVAPRHRQRFGGRNCVAQFLVPGHCNLVLVLSLGHYGAVLDLRKFLRFLG